MLMLLEDLLLPRLIRHYSFSPLPLRCQRVTLHMLSLSPEMLMIAARASHFPPFVTLRLST